MNQIITVYKGVSLVFKGHDPKKISRGSAPRPPSCICPPPHFLVAGAATACINKSRILRQAVRRMYIAVSKRPFCKPPFQGEVRTNSSPRARVIQSDYKQITNSICLFPTVVLQTTSRYRITHQTKRKCLLISEM